MLAKVLGVLSCVLMYNKALGYEPILVQISSGKNSCNEENLFSKFSLSQVPQFGAICDIPIPNNKQVEILLKDNVIPILCMGVYDVSLRLCKSASEDIVPFSDIFPPTKDKFKRLFERLEKDDSYSSLEEFCSVTVPNHAIKESSSNITSLWWNVLNQQLNSYKSCLTTCRTNENSKVHPLCLYIIWSNGVYKNYLKNQEEIRGTALGVGGDETNLAKLSLKKNFDSNQLLIPDDKKSQLNVNNTEVANTAANTTQSAATNLPGSAAVAELSVNTPKNISAINVDSSVTLEGKPTKKGKVGKKHSKTQVHNNVINAGPTVTGEKEGSKDNVRNGESQVAPAQQDVGSSDTNLAPPQHDVGSSNTNLASPQQEVGSSDKNLVPPQQDGGSSDKNLVPPQQDGGSSDKNLVPPQQVVGSSVTNLAPPQDIGSSDTNLAPPQLQSKPGDPLTEGDFSFEQPQDEIESEQPFVGKDPQDSDEMENGDGDDVDMEPEGETSNKMSADKSSSDPGTNLGDGAKPKPQQLVDEIEKIQMNDPFVEAEDSNFFPYFLCAAVLTIMAYLVFHNKKKLVALAIEGRKTRGSRRRPNCSNYSKLDCSLEEAMVSNTTASVTHVLY